MRRRPSKRNFHDAIKTKVNGRSKNNKGHPFVFMEQRRQQFQITFSSKEVNLRAIALWEEEELNSVVVWLKHNGLDLYQNVLFSIANYRVQLLLW